MRTAFQRLFSEKYIYHWIDLFNKNIYQVICFLLIRDLRMSGIGYPVFREGCSTVPEVVFRLFFR